MQEVIIWQIKFNKNNRKEYKLQHQPLTATDRPYIQTEKPYLIVFYDIKLTNIAAVRKALIILFLSVKCLFHKKPP